MLSLETISTMDGPALTQLAWEIGLTPQDQTYLMLPGPGQRIAHIVAGIGSLNMTELWEPHANLAHADAILRKLRVRGWDTTVQYFARPGAGQVGLWKWGQDNQPVGDWGQWQEPTEEAITLLRCALRALASEQAQMEKLRGEQGQTAGS